MSTKSVHLSINGLDVAVERKSIKNLHLGVYPPAGRVRVAAPSSMSDDAVRLAVIDKLSWIKKQQAKFAAQPRQSERQFLTGETHFFFGRRYRLRVIEFDQPAQIRIVGKSVIELTTRPGSTAEQREKVFQEWQREELKRLIPPLIEKWQNVVGVVAAEWGVKRMKTKWGSCNIEARRIWINLELAKKPPESLEYIIVHELAHLRERNHNDRFVAIMDGCLPKWRILRDELNRAPLVHEDWGY